jgi:hypothetical protein
VLFVRMSENVQEEFTEGNNVARRSRMEEWEWGMVGMDGLRCG